MAIVWKQCHFAYLTGILPEEAHLNDQDALFAECYPTFVETYVELDYQRKMKDQVVLAESFLENLAVMWGGKSSKGKKNGGRQR